MVFDADGIMKKLRINKGGQNAVLKQAIRLSIQDVTLV